MWILLQVLARIGLGIGLAIVIAAARSVAGDAPIAQAVRAAAVCQPIEDGIWRGETVPPMPHARLVQVSLTVPNMMPIMFGCGSAKRT
jgi:hypothetical protein